MPLAKRTVDTGAAAEASLSFTHLSGEGPGILAVLSTAGEIPQPPPEVQNSSQDCVFLPNNESTFFLPCRTEQKVGLGCCPRPYQIIPGRAFPFSPTTMSTATETVRFPCACRHCKPPEYP